MVHRACKVRVSGRVQGVCFRAATQQQAKALGVCGWVRNLADGTVEAWLQADADHLAAMLKWMQHGPVGAKVTAVDVHADQAPEPNLRSFEIRH